MLGKNMGWVCNPGHIRARYRLLYFKITKKNIFKLDESSKQRKIQQLAL